LDPLRLTYAGDVLGYSHRAREFNMAVFGNTELENIIKKVLLILSVVLIAGLIVYIILDQHSQETGNDNATVSSTDIRLYDVIFRSRSGGSTRWEMNARILEQETKSSSYVRLGQICEWIFYKDDKAVMSVAAEGARVLKRTQDVELEGPIEVLLWIDSNKGGESVE
jgi:preprotein translocase subunit SecG